MIAWGLFTYTYQILSPIGTDPDTFAPLGLDIDQWLDAVGAAGMHYVVFGAKFHDGFALWPTEWHAPGYPPYSIAQTDWYTNNGSPDIVEMVIDKCRERNLKIVIGYSIWDRNYEDQTGGILDSPAMIAAQLTELLTNYGNIDGLWFDGWGWKHGYDHITYADVYNLVKGLQPNCLIVENSHTHPTVTSEIETYEAPNEGHIPADNTLSAEETDSIYVNGAWFCNEQADQSDSAFTAASTILTNITNANDRNGTYTLCVGVNRSGVLPAACVTRLAQLG